MISNYTSDMKWTYEMLAMAAVTDGSKGKLFALCSK